MYSSILFSSMKRKLALSYAVGGDCLSWCNIKNRFADVLDPFIKM